MIVVFRLKRKPICKLHCTQFWKENQYGKCFRGALTLTTQTGSYVQGALKLHTIFATNAKGKSILAQICGILFPSYKLAWINICQFVCTFCANSSITESISDWIPGLYWLYHSWHHFHFHMQKQTKEAVSVMQGQIKGWIFFQSR